MNVCADNRINVFGDSQLTLSVEDRYVIGGQAIFCLDPDEQRRAPPRGHALTWERLRLEAQRESSFLQRNGRNAADFQTLWTSSNTHSLTNTTNAVDKDLPIAAPPARLTL